jgi:hypothetical protein
MEILNLGANAYLSEEFGIAPMLRDIQTLRSIILEKVRQIDYLVNNQGKLLTKHWKVPLKEFVGYSNTNVFPVTTLGGHEITRNVLYTSIPMFNATLRFSYTITKFESEHARMLSMLDAAGVHWNPAHIWRAIPWSFVIDWVVSIGRFLDQFRVRNIEPVTYIRGYCFSVDIRRVISLTGSFWKDEPLGSKGVPITVIRERAYKRRAFFPDYLRAITTSGLSAKEFSFSASLAFTHRRHLR